MKYIHHLELYMKKKWDENLKCEKGVECEKKGTI